MRTLSLLLALAALLATAGTAQARGLKQLGGISFGTGGSPPPAVPIGGGSGSQCIDSFQAWLQTIDTCTGTTAECCSGLLSLGETCWGEVLDSLAGNQTLVDAA
jgi:hypothetical protein